MLLQITNKCTMECSHCMVECTAKGDKMMSMETLDLILDSGTFSTSIGILVSGGEPTEHPEFFSIVQRILDRRSGLQMVYILSNGLWAHSEHMTQQMLQIVDQNEFVTIQITHDPRFYPLPIRRLEHSKITYIDELRLLVPLGRAYGENPEDYGLRARIAPQCYNQRSFMHTKKDSSVIDLNSFMEVERLKHCTLGFDWDGNMLLSECCRLKAGNIRDENLIEKAAELLRTKPCNHCGLYAKMPEELRIF